MKKGQFVRSTMTSWKRRHGKRRNDRWHQDPKVPVQAHRRRPRNSLQTNSDQNSSQSRPDRTIMMLSIEEQLERQRRKRTVGGKQSDKSEGIPLEKMEQSKVDLGNYRYDPVRDAYFPADSFSNHDDDRIRNHNNKTTDQSPRPPSFTWTHRNLSHGPSLLPADMSRIPFSVVPPSVEVCDGTRRCHSLRTAWASRVVRNRMQVVSTLSSTNGSGQCFSMLSPLRNMSHVVPRVEYGCDMPLDLDCKFALHPTARTMDIHMGPDPTKLPSVATLVKGGCSVRVARQPRLWKVPSEPTDQHWDLSMTPAEGTGVRPPHAIRFSPHRLQDPTSVCFATVSRKIAGTANICQLWRCAHGEIESYEAECDVGVNDLAFHPEFSTQEPTIVLGANYSRARFGGCFGPHVFDLGRRELFARPAARFPESDSLRVEYLAKNSTALFGHRNGLISLVDFRSMDVSLLACLPSENQGSISGLKILNGHDQAPRLILAKHSFGCCSMFDIRRIGGIASSLSKSLVWNVDTGGDKATSRHTEPSRCSGLFVDPQETFVISPSADRIRKASLGFWSLSSGRYLGSQQIAGSAGDTLEQADEMGDICELSDTITPAWQIHERSDGEMLVEKKSGWGLWLKCGALPSERSKALGCMGSIKHVTFNGDVILDAQEVLRRSIESGR